jgi:hypothetical protein
LHRTHWKALPGFMPAPDVDRFYLLCQQALEGFEALARGWAFHAIGK